MQLRGVDPQLAEGLVTVGCRSLADFAWRPLSELETSLADAQAKGVLPEVPGSDVLAAAQVDAATLHFTGTVSGVVLDADERPVAGCAVRVGRRRGTTSDSGRFRITRVPLGRPTYELVLEKEGFETRVEAGLRPAHGDGTLELRTFQLDPAPASAPEPRRLSELEGNRLPPMAGQPIAIEELPELRARDVLKVRELEGDDAVLLSKFRAYSAGSFLVGRARVPASSLPADAKAGDVVVVDEAGQLRPLQRDARAVHRVKERVIGLRQAGPTPGASASKEERQAFMRRVLEARLRHRFGPRFRGLRKGEES